MTSELAAATARLANGPVTPTFDPARFRHELAAFDFTKPCAIEDVLVWTIAQMEHGTVHITHPRYFGLFNPAPVFPAICADRIVAVFNPQLATATTSPAPVAIEIACDPGGGAARRLAAVGRRAFHHRRVRGQLHRAHRGAGQRGRPVCHRWRTRVRRPASLLRVARLSSCLDQARRDGRPRPFSGAVHRDRRLRPHGHPGFGAGDRR